MAWQDIQTYNDRFYKKSVQFKAGPVQARSCTQWGCLFLFALIFIATFGGGAYFIYAGKDSIAQMITQTQANQSNTGFGYIMAKMSVPIVGMLILSSALSVAVVLLSRLFPKPTMYFLIGFTFLAYVAIIIAGFALGSIALSIVFIIVLLLNALILYCYRQYIQIGLKLMQCAVRFIIQKPAVYFISIMCLFLNVAYTVFWVFSWLGVYSSGVIQDNTTYKILTYIWYVDAIFWGFYLYYIMVFLIASACAYWYYKSQDNSVLRGISNLRYHLGSICYASIVITVITMLRVLAQSQNSDNGALRLIACIIRCILQMIQDLMKVLNNNAVIVMSVTGQGYIASAKSAISLIFDNLPLFIIVDYFTDFYQFFSKFFIALVPAIIGGIIIYIRESADNQAKALDNSSAMTYAIWGAIIIALLAMVISSVIVGMINQALSCIFIFYCFDAKFRAMGIVAENIPVEIKEIFDRASGNSTAHQASMNYLNRNQRD